ncbi:MAG TPA: ABC transporter permease [Terriglobales bacterium]|nr:ABC transporter permease [Terriglobales bacterium]
MSIFSAMSRRMMMRSFTVRKGRTFTALMALTTAAAVATGMLNLYVDLEAKLTREFSKVGANVVVTRVGGDELTPEAVEAVLKSLGGQDVAVPVAFAIAKTQSGHPIVVAGIDMDAARKANAWWSVNGDGPALIGDRAAEALKLEDDPTVFTFKGKTLKLAAAGTLKTGGPEESRIYLPRQQFEQWTGVRPSIVEVSVQGGAREVEAAIARVQQNQPTLTATPVRQVTEAQTHVLGKTKAVLLASTLVIVVLVVVCVISSLAASVLERRKDFAVMKALGSSQRAVASMFLTEAFLLALTASLLGYAIGSGAAAVIGRLNFHAAVVPRLGVFPPVMFGVIIVALISAALPLVRLQKLEPAVMLKGD